MALPTNSTQLSTMRPHRLSQFLKISAADTGISDAAGNTTPDTNWIPCAGYNQATVLVKYVRGSGGSTRGNIDFNIDVSDDESTEYQMMTSAVSAGVATLSVLKYRFDCSNVSKNWIVDFPLSYEFFRVKDLTVANGASDDDMTITIFLGNI